MSTNTLRLQILMNAVDRVTAPFRSIRAQSQRVAQQMQEQQQKLRELDNLSKRMEGYKKLQQQVSKASNQFDKAKERARQLRQAMQQMENPTDEMKEAFKAAQAEAKKLQQRHKQLTEQQRQSSQHLRDLGIDTNRLADHERELQQQLNRTTEELEQQRRAAQRLQQQQERLNRARSTYDRTMNARNQLAGTGGGMIATGVATGYLLSKPISAFAETEDAATQLKVSMMMAGGAVSADFEKINSLALKLGDRLPGTTADFQNMMTVLRRQGMSANSILGGLGEATALLAVQLKMPTEAAAEFAAKMQDATSATESEMLGLMDTIQRGFYLGVDDNNMLEGFANLSPLLKTLRMQGKEAADALMPLLVITDQAAIKGSTAGIAINKAFSLPLDADKVFDANTLLKQFGIKEKLNFTKDGNSLDIKNLFVQFEKLKQLNDEQFNAVFKEIWGDDAETKKTIQALMNKGFQGYQEVQQKMAAQADLQTRVNEQLGTLKNLWEAAGGTFTNTLASFAQTVAPELKQLTTWLGEVAEKTNAWIKANPKLAGWIFKIAAGFSALAIVGGSLSLALAAILGPFAIVRFALTTLGIRIIPIVIGAFKGILGVIGALFSPIGIFIAVIVAAAVLIYKYWEPIKAFFIGVWQGLKESFAGVSEGFEPLKPLFNWIGNAISKAITWIKNFIQPVKSTSQELQNATNYGRKFGEYLAIIFKMLLWPIKQVINAISWMSDAIGNAINFFSSKWDEAGSKTESVIGRIATFFALSLSGIRDSILNSEFVATLKTKATEAVDFFSSKWDEAGANTNNSLDRIKMFFSTSLSSIITEIKNWAVTSGFQEKFNEVIAFFSSLTEQFLQLGKEIAISIWEGIKNEFSALKNDMTSLLKSSFGFGEDEVEVKQKIMTETSTVGAITNQAMQTLPLYDKGGFIPSGRLGIVGERGPEIVNGPANITGRLKTAKIATAAAMLASMPIAALQQSAVAIQADSFQSVLSLTPGSNDAVDSRFTSKPKIMANTTLPGSTNSVAPVTMNTSITINASAGQNPTDIAKEVTRILDERERRASARVRSSMRDID